MHAAEAAAAPAAAPAAVPAAAPAPGIFFIKWMTPDLPVPRPTSVSQR